MSRKRFGLILAAALIAICAAFYLSSRRSLQHDTQGVLLLPTLAPEIDTVTEVVVRKGGATPVVTLHQPGGVWSVEQLGDYPADIAKVHKLLLGFSEAKIVEEKTSDPANYSIIGVEDPTKPGAGGAEVTFSAKDGKHAFIVGKPIGDGDFVRREGEAKSYSVAPSVSVETEPKAWIDARLMNIQGIDVQSVEFKPATGQGYLLRRMKPAEAKPADAKTADAKPADAKPAVAPDVPGPGFALETPVPAGRKALDSKALTPSRVALMDIRAEDVAKADAIDFSKAIQAIFTLSDGNVLTLTGTPVGDKRWIKIQATKDDALTAKVQNRAFEVASYRYDAMFRPLEDLLVPKGGAAPPADKSPGANPAGPGMLNFGTQTGPASKPTKPPKTAAPAPAP